MLKTLPHAIPKVASPTEKIPNEGFNSNIEQVQAYLTRHYEFKYNSVTQRLLVRIRNADEQYHYLEDYEFNSILKKIKIQNIKCSKDMLLMILKSDYVLQFGPFLNYLENLPEWDGTDYVAQLATSVRTT